jgi:hypothetical protein
MFSLYLIHIDIDNDIFTCIIYLFFFCDALLFHHQKNSVRNNKCTTQFPFISMSNMSCLKGSSIIISHVYIHIYIYRYRYTYEQYTYIYISINRLTSFNINISKRNDIYQAISWRLSSNDSGPGAQSAWRWPDAPSPDPGGRSWPTPWVEDFGTVAASKKLLKTWSFEDLGDFDRIL